MQPKILWPRFLGVIKSIFWAPGTLKTAAPGPRAARAHTTRRLFLVPLRRGPLCSRGGRRRGEQGGPPRSGEGWGVGGEPGMARRGRRGVQAGRRAWGARPRGGRRDRSCLGSTRNLRLLPGLFFSGADSCVPGAGIHLSRGCSHPEIC